MRYDAIAVEQPRVSARPVPGAECTRRLPSLLVGFTAMLTLGACSGGRGAAATHVDTAGGAVAPAPGGTPPPAPTAAGAAGAATGPLPTAVTDVGTYGEDLYDAVERVKWSQARALFDSLERSVRALPADVPLQGTRAVLGGVMDTLRRAIPARQRETALEAANRVTYLSAEMTAPYRPATPVEVLLLDYYGREIVDWSARRDSARLAQTSADLRRTWDTLRPVVAQHGGGAAAARTDSLVARIGAARTPRAYARLATPFLDEVDELEKVFTKQ